MSPSSPGTRSSALETKVSTSVRFQLPTSTRTTTTTDLEVCDPRPACSLLNYAFTPCDGDYLVALLIMAALVLVTYFFMGLDRNDKAPSDIRQEGTRDKEAEQGNPRSTNEFVKFTFNFPVMCVN
ncbi:hypothetical protein PC117_g8090 [Phytophthora cactorum]|uniref:Uncharacterized protein n=2 Tax=Phytophthora cactorum TaxID=29920 RepID=A0A8T1DW17_9STRA|nr:hypothetical protein PC117_g8090 [Phytophthora cactorum]